MESICAASEIWVVNLCKKIERKVIDISSGVFSQTSPPSPRWIYTKLIKHTNTLAHENSRRRMCAQKYKFREPISVSHSNTNQLVFSLFTKICRFVLFCLNHCYHRQLFSRFISFFAATAAVCRYLFSFSISFFHLFGLCNFVSIKSLVEKYLPYCHNHQHQQKNYN